MARITLTCRSFPVQYETEHLVIRIEDAQPVNLVLKLMSKADVAEWFRISVRKVEELARSKDLLQSELTARSVSGNRCALVVDINSGTAAQSDFAGMIVHISAGCCEQPTIRCRDGEGYFVLASLSETRMLRPGLRSAMRGQIKREMQISVPQTLCGAERTHLRYHSSFCANSATDTCGPCSILDRETGTSRKRGFNLTP